MEPFATTAYSDTPGAVHASLSAGEETLDRLKGLFLASLNHEIRTPLSGILGMTDLLLETPLSSEQQEYVSTTRACAENLFEILNATLEFAALSAGRLVLDESEFSIAEVLDSTVHAYYTKARAKGLRLVSTLDEQLPETLLGDAPRIRQMLGHLVANAVKFTSDGQVEVRATLSLLPDGREALELAVADTGIGIEDEKLANIFESFKQLDSGLSRTYSGLGLGLALAQKLAGLMEGRISVDSKVGLGSTFRILLPLRHAALEEPRPHEIAPLPAQAATRAVLVVEDNEVGQQVLRHVFSRQPYQVDFASTGRGAVAAARARQYDLILMDLQIPDMDGFETTDAIRGLAGYQKVPVLALTANSSDEYRRLCLQRGLQAFLSKPIQAQELLGAVRRFLPS